VNNDADQGANMNELQLKQSPVAKTGMLTIN
jgi:hypothetical protein